MGATIGLSRFISLLPAFDSKFYSFAIISAIILFLIQQIVIMSSFMPIKRLSELCKSYFQETKIINYTKLYAWIHHTFTNVAT